MLRTNLRACGFYALAIGLFVSFYSVVGIQDAGAIAFNDIAAGDWSVAATWNQGAATPDGDVVWRRRK